MFKLKYLLFVIPVFLLTVWVLSSKNVYDDQACALAKMAVKGKVTEVVQNHELVFYIDTINTFFPFHFNQHQNSYQGGENTAKDDAELQPMTGDSIEKKANSISVKFKRGNKIFFKSIRLGFCNCKCK